MSGPTRHEYVSFSHDPEVQSIEVMCAVLEPLEPHTRHRILMYLADRYAGGDWPDTPMG